MDESRFSHPEQTIISGISRRRVLGGVASAAAMALAFPGRGSIAAEDDLRILDAYQLQGVKVGANPQDKWVLEGYTSLVVITQYGDVFGHDLVPDAEGHLTVGAAVQFEGPKVAANPPDKWVLNLGDHLVVVTQDGGVFGHTFDGATAIGEPFKFQGQPVGSRTEDRWVLRHGDRLIVITEDGGVFGHELDIAGKVVGDAYPFQGPNVAANQPDHWVLIAFDTILVVTTDGGVFAHDLDLRGRAISQPYAVDSPPVAAGARDKWVIIDEPGGEIVVITEDGDVFAHPTQGLVPAS